MDPRIWQKVAALSGIAALGLGSYGAHGFKPQNPTYKEVWHTASLYHLVHTAALISAPLTKYPNIFGGLLTTGILAFSGTFSTYDFSATMKLEWRCYRSGTGTKKMGKKIYVHVGFECLVFKLGFVSIDLSKSVDLLMEFLGDEVEDLLMCYTVAFLEDRKYSTLAPVGGFAFIAAWGSLLF
ncbi:hypothetical protein U1Q18_024390 [Sarracenia purpurea var. burkii]